MAPTGESSADTDTHIGGRRAFTPPDPRPIRAAKYAAPRKELAESLLRIAEEGAPQRPLRGGQHTGHQPRPARYAPGGDEPVPR
ncbi:hypothetical protein [Streptomyces sp. NPDC047061]|uniref:hypothetical protein n=1 Tax=Streptomyces sp. NPDC047061 TaxID=3154605 RepID=UPI003407738F